MSDRSIDGTVPMTVSRPPADTDGRIEPVDFSVTDPTYNLVVPIAGDLFDEQTGINVRRFVQTAVAIAADSEGQVVLLGVAEIAEDATLDRIESAVHSIDDPGLDTQSIPQVVEDRRSQLERVTSALEDVGESVPIRARVLVVPDTTDGMLRTLAEDSNTAALLMRGGSLDRSWLLGRSTVDALISSADCDLFVENVGAAHGESGLYVPDTEGHAIASLSETESESVDSILLCIDDGPHSALAAEGARAVATVADAKVKILHVIDPDGETPNQTDAADLVDFAEFVLGPSIDVETTIERGREPADIILQAATKHDVTVIGAPEQKSRLEGLTFDPLQDVLSSQGDCTVLVARDRDRTMRSLYYQWRQAMNADEANDGSNE